MPTLTESHKDAILRILRNAKTCLTAGEIAEKLNAEGQDRGWSPVLVIAEVSQLPEVYKSGEKYCLKGKKEDSAPA